MKSKIEALSIDSQLSILSALKRMDALNRKLLIVTGKGKFKSLLSIGDIQRAIIQNRDLKEPINNILRAEVKVAHQGEDREAIKTNMRERRNEFMPVIDYQGQVVEIIFWEDLFETDKIKDNSLKDIPVVVMAGGKGSRLQPLTNVLPKALIPIGKQTILEDIMDRFADFGCRDFYLSLNYKADMIRQYIKENKSSFHIAYCQETQPLGTAGSLYLLKDSIQSTFFVSNCDILIDENYGEILNYHRENSNEITVVGALKSMSLPYGSLETKKGGVLKALSEKPEYTFKINTGMYVLEPQLLHEIPENQFYDITDLIQSLLDKHRKVGVFPINQGSWIDIGNWEEYMQIIKK
ncbi:MAG TPA: nucleotidyltransferase family protein [Bacteroidales bacterium]|nr:nucleotidyltransferase family protein [Bacteroidales bacterium]